MQRQRGTLVPVGEALADLSGPIQALRLPLPARRGFYGCRSGEPACLGQ